MAIREHPKIGTILMCDFDSGFTPPEMVKRRPVVVVSPKIVARPGLCTVVPLSTTAPDPVMQFHCQIDLPDLLPDWLDKKGVWVKADMMVAVALSRLDFIRLAKSRQGKREYCFSTITSDNLRTIRGCILAGLGLAHLTKSL
ncbi:PemK-like protein [Brevundimonas sp. SH203]|uniref:type II toxin-antitoxin system PemK/MazF family toxin n=1 Tax=Brevundimonas sp. SH203 TaxID=345167 RepID=UPI0009CC19E4|nr:type II toxin-antitoxin system PemK/MazF family toxin [Brevundimonas sp. SH203]GAW42051.1 PemK-like protein [Brevundimonas sp. SH203]